MRTIMRTLGCALVEESFEAGLPGRLERNVSGLRSWHGAWNSLLLSLLI